MVSIGETDTAIQLFDMAKIISMKKRANQLNIPHIIILE